jgi:NAD(P)-dependent dehydrogenase (short-subunit alcohol dehydrogenase family)
MRNPFSLKAKKIFVTGASSGIGRAVAIECSKLGAQMVITGRNEERLNDTFIKLEGNGHTQLISDLHGLINTSILDEKITGLDGIVHCAGIVKTFPFQFATAENLDLIMDTNFKYPVLITRRIMKDKIIIKNASIVFISSISGVNVSMPGNSIYSASKGAINGIVKGMALDLASKGIRVNSITPGMIETDILHDGTISEEQLKKDIKNYPMARYGRPEEIAYAAIYLLSDASSWVTGSNLLIDGGYTLK